MLLLDTDIIIEILRKSPPALVFLQSLGTTEIGLPGLVVMELIQGCRNSVEQRDMQNIINPYDVFWPTELDCQRAQSDFATYYLSDNIGILDALIGHTAVGLNVALATFNLRHYRVINGLQLLQPYTRK